MFPMGFSYKNTKKISANIDIILRVHHILKAKKNGGMGYRRVMFLYL